MTEDLRNVREVNDDKSFAVMLHLQTCSFKVSLLPSSPTLPYTHADLNPFANTCHSQDPRGPLRTTHDYVPYTQNYANTFDMANKFKIHDDPPGVWNDMFLRHGRHIDKLGHIMNSLDLAHMHNPNMSKHDALDLNSH